MFKSVALAALAMGGASALLRDRSYYEAKFVDWLQEHNIKLRNGEEFVYRLSVFASNDDFINEENAKGLTYELGHNKYSMYTHEEFVEMMHLDRPMPPRPTADSIHDNADVTAVPSTVDWVSAGAVTGVKDQGQCGSCWSFSTTGCLEGIFYIKNKNLQSFSEQQLVSCDTDGANQGCNGGWMDDAFTWIKNNGGLCTESAYPYTSGTTGVDGTCQSSCNEVAGSTVSSFTDVATNNESAMQTAVAQQPLSVAINASSRGFQMYKSGVFTGPCLSTLNHGVLVVGYGTSGSTPYWKVKNSWGTSWGDQGYILMERNTGGKGLCGIAQAPSYANL